MFVDIWRTLVMISAEDGLLRHRSQAALGPPQTTAKSVLLAWMEWLLKLQTWLVKQWYLSIYLSIYLYIYINGQPHGRGVFIWWYIYIYIYIYILKRRAAVEHLLTYACINLISQCQPWATSITVYKIYNPPSGIPCNTVQVSSLKTTSGQLRFQFPIKSFTALTIPDVSMEDAEHLYPWAFATRTQTTWCWLF